MRERLIEILSYMGVFLLGWLIGFGMAIYSSQRKGKNW